MFSDTLHWWWGFVLYDLGGALFAWGIPLELRSGLLLGPALSLQASVPRRWW